MITGNNRKILTVFLTLTMICVAGSVYSTNNGSIEVSAIYPRDELEVIQDISSRVGNDNDIWLDEEQIEPDHILLGHELNMQVNIYYDLPVTDEGTDDQSSALGDIFEVTLIVSLVDNSSRELVEMVNEMVRLEDLNTNPKGIEIFNIKVPWESFDDHIKRWRTGDNDTKNFMKVEIRDVPGGANMSDFEKSVDNNVVILELYTVYGTDSFVPHFYNSGEQADEFINSELTCTLSIALSILLLFLVIKLAFILKKKSETGKDEELPTESHNHMDSNNSNSIPERIDDSGAKIKD